MHVSGDTLTWLDGTPQRLADSDILHLELGIKNHAHRVATTRTEEQSYVQVWDADAQAHLFFEVVAK